MHITWFGQSAFLIEGSKRIFIDPFGDASEALAARGIRFDYPRITGIEADLLLVTHEHMDHNAVEVIGGEPAVIRSQAGTHESSIGDIVGVASEHDQVAGTQRGPNTIYCFTLDDTRFAHFGDFGQAALRPEQRDAIGQIDVLFLPAGAGPTVGGEAAAEIVRQLRPRVTIPMHYGNEAVDFLDPPDAFLDALGAPVERLDANAADVAALKDGVAVFGVPTE
jgi:L-ascorbate metabolism protein UlaG (beta-lactamase superfamily)